jgi:formylglycine-generating enzyme required for sulfatase activity/serine/threonine protein kinase
MTSVTDGSSAVDEVLADYMRRVDAGESVDQKAILAAHPEVASELRSYFDMELEVIRRAGPSVADSMMNSLDAPIASGTSTHNRRQRDTHHGGKADARSGNAERKPIPQQFGRYRVLRELGRGAMGTVYLAEDSQLGRQVALKTSSFADQPDGELLARFLREARLAAVLRHAHICPVYEVGEIDGWHYISMAYIEGQTLSAIIQQNSPLPEKQTLHILRKVALALQEAHDHGIIHRDLKPGNILYDRKGEPIITDFGLARRAGGEEQARITQEGMMIGSPAYMSPEQFEGQPDRLTPASDQYSLGVILYEMLTGHLPFRGPLRAIITAILTKSLPPLREARPDVDPRTEAICRRLTARLPENRYPSLKAAAAEITAILKSPAVASQETSPAAETAGGRGAQTKVSPKTATPAPPAKGPAPPGRPVDAEARKSKPKPEAELTDAAIESLGATAKKLLAQRDFQQALPLLESIPEDRRTEDIDALLERAHRQADEVMCLVTEIDDAVRVNDVERVLEKTEALRKIKPNHPRVKKVQDQFGEYGGVYAARGFGKGAASESVVGEGTWIPWGVLAFGLAVFGLALWGVTAYLKVGDAIVKVTINDPEVRVTIQGTTVNIEGASAPLKVNPGDGTLKITLGDLSFESSSFMLNKGKNPTVQIELLDQKLAAKFGDQSIGEWEVERKRPAEAAGKPAAAEGDADAPALVSAPFDAARAKAAQTEWSRYLGVPVQYSNTLGMQFVLIPPGEYTQGSPDKDSDASPDERPAHRVRISRPMYLGVTEVTQGQYQVITGKNPFQFQKGGVEERRAQGIETKDFPAESVSWNDATQFCQLLADKHPPAAGNKRAEGYRLPTEAEWEYACRAGTSTRWSFGDELVAVSDRILANQDGRESTPKPVGNRSANAWGLQDMHGSLYEWCADDGDGGDYAPLAGKLAVDPYRPAKGLIRMVRGGSWDTPTADARSARRLKLAATAHGQSTGFRVAIVLAPKSQTPATAAAPFNATQARELQAQWASHLGVPAEHTNSIGMTLRLIPPGDYLVGATAEETDAALAKVRGDGAWEERLRSSAPQHRVTLTKPYYIGVYEVTQKEFESVLGRNPSYLAPKGQGAEFVPGQDRSNAPVERLTWGDAVEFCNRLSEREKLTSSYTGTGDSATIVAGKGYRLPTESEWEAACRAGTSTLYWFGSDEASFPDVGWFVANAGNQSHPVGQRKPNPFGLHDTHGNVWEWCQDLYDPQAYVPYAAKAAVDPSGPTTASPLHRVFRGGGFTFDAGKQTSAIRAANAPGAIDHTIGFRVLLPVSNAIRR